MKRAAIYIRVSTKDQAKRAGSSEGYSLPTQRNDCLRKAKALGAVVAEDAEYVDKDTGTSTDKRPAMQALLERIQTKADLDYVIVFKLERWARMAREDLITDFILETAGCQLVSCSEGIDRTPAGRLVHGMLASVNEYQSRNQSDEIKRKTLAKVQQGGTPGKAPIGYLNVRLDNRGDVRTVVVDPERAPLITWAFEAYATGEWTVIQLTEELEKRGLRSLGGPNRPSKPLGLSVVHKMLRHPYYKGVIRWKGVLYEGDHPKLVDHETWQRVQDTLSSRYGAEKQRKHHHYLKGTIFCGHCRSRLCIQYARGRHGGIYPYYFCLGRSQKRTTCMLKYRPLEWVEEQIEEHYRLVQLLAEGIEQSSAAILAELTEQETQATKERERQELRIQQLDNESAKLLQAHYADAVPLHLLKSEQDRIARERVTAETLLAAAQADFDKVQATLALATGKLRDCYQAYLEAGPRERRLMNQALFERVLVTEEGVIGWDYAEPFGGLMKIHAALVEAERQMEQDHASEPEELARLRPAHSAGRQRGYHRRKSPGVWARAFPVTGSKENVLVEVKGFEPSASALRTLRSAN